MTSLECSFLEPMGMDTCIHSRETPTSAFEGFAEMKIPWIKLVSLVIFLLCRVLQTQFSFISSSKRRKI